MLPAKTKRFADIKDEVRDFHPILMKLLPKLPKVLDVEYTHEEFLEDLSPWVNPPSNPASA